MIFKGLSLTLIYYLSLTTCRKKNKNKIIIIIIIIKLQEKLSLLTIVKTRKKFEDQPTWISQRKQVAMYFEGFETSQAWKGQE